MKPSQTTAVLVTRGDQDLSPIISTLSGFRDIIIAKPDRYESLLLGRVLKQPERDHSVYGRYHAAIEAWMEINKGKAVKYEGPFPIYVQDDDCITDPEQIISTYSLECGDGEKIVCNMPAIFRKNYKDGIALVGFGAIFDASLILPAMGKYGTRFDFDQLFLNEADRIFTRLNKQRWIDVAYENTAAATGDDRMYRRFNHVTDLAEIRSRLALLGAIHPLEVHS